MWSCIKNGLLLLQEASNKDEGKVLHLFHVFLQAIDLNGLFYYINADFVALGRIIFWIGCWRAWMWCVREIWYLKWWSNFLFSFVCSNTSKPLQNVLLTSYFWRSLQICPGMFWLYGIEIVCNVILWRGVEMIQSLICINSHHSTYPAGKWLNSRKAPDVLPSTSDMLT